MSMFDRRTILIAPLIATGALFAGSAAWAAPQALPDDMTMGNPKAKIEVIEYASAACPHCAHFNEAVFADFKTRWIDTGKARYTLKEMLTEPATVAAASFMIARCAGPAKYFTVVDQVFRSQPEWTGAKIKPILQKIAADNGVDEAHFNACLSDQAAANAVAARAQRAAEQDGVDSTPTIFINGKKVDPTPMTAADMDAAMLLAAGGPAPTPSAKKGAR
jgi:protein-disulfide isomerase